MKILFLTGSVDISGGNYVVFEHAMFAMRSGHSVTVAVLSKQDIKSENWHPALAAIEVIDLNDAVFLKYDIAIATFWRTALELHRINAVQYAYFVQSIESRFYSENEKDSRDAAESTYSLGLPGITEASWIKQYLGENYKSNYFLARNGIRKDLYHPEGNVVAQRIPGKIRILVEGPFQVPIKNTGTGLRLIRKAGPLDTFLLTSSKLVWHPQVSKVFSRVPITLVPPIYRSCDVLLKLSYVEGMFGPPLEMFHCGGTAIVYDVSGHDEYMVHEQNSLIAPSRNEDKVVEYLNLLASDSYLLKNLKEGALETAQAWPDWNESSAIFMRQLMSIYDSPKVSRDELRDKSIEIYSKYEKIFSNPPNLTRHGKSTLDILMPLKTIKKKVSDLKKQYSFIMESY